MDNNVNENEKKIKWTKGRIIKTIIYCITLALVILLLVVSCNKNKVKAYSYQMTKTFPISDLDGTFSGGNNFSTSIPSHIYACYFRFPTNQTTFSLTNLISFEIENNGWFIIKVEKASNGYYSFNISSSANYGVNEYFYYFDSANSDDITFYVALSSVGVLRLDTGYISNAGGHFAVSSYHYSFQHIVAGNINLSYLSSYWLTDSYTSINSVALADSIYNMMAGGSIPTSDIYEYHQEYLFGDLISSFLNIKFADVNIGGVSYDLTLGILLLFILGLGALFIVIKVFLGG